MERATANALRFAVNHGSRRSAHHGPTATGFASLLHHGHNSSTTPRKRRWRPRLSPLTCRRTYAAAAPGSDFSRRIAIVGGGLTGLTTAYWLAKLLPTRVGITLFESSGRLGGWIETDRIPVNVEGWKGTVSFERGPRTLSSLYNNMWRFDDLVLYSMALDLGLTISKPKDQPRYIYYPDHLVPLNLPWREALAEKLWQDCLPAVVGFPIRFSLRVLRHLVSEPFKSDDISAADWMRYVTMGRSVGDNMLSAMAHGIHGGDIDKLSARAVLDRFYWKYNWAMLEMEALEDELPVPAVGARIVENLSKDERVCELAREPKGSLMHFGTAGMSALTDALADALRRQPNVDIRLNTPVRSIQFDTREQKTTLVASKSAKHEVKRPVAYDRVISTLMSHELANLTGPHKLPSLAERRAVSLYCVNVWYPLRDDDPDDLKPKGFGYLIPRSIPPEQNPERALGIFFDADVGVLGPQEPEGCKLFVLMGGHYYEPDDPQAVPPPASNAAAVEQAKAVIERHLGIPRTRACHAMARLARDCIPQHHVGHTERMVSTHEDLMREFKGRLIVAGGSYTAIGAMGAMAAGYTAARLAARTEVGATGLEHFLEGQGFFKVDKHLVERCRSGKVKF